MWAESAPGQGSTFHFTLALPAAASVALPTDKGQSTVLANRRLLIVDDNETNIRMLTLLAARWGLVARGTQSTEEALNWLRDGEQFDLAILDMQMPGMDGLRLAAEIRKLELNPALPLVLLTSMGVSASSPEFAGTFASCLTKPVKPAQLLEVLVRVLADTQPEPERKHAAKLDPLLARRLPLRVLVCDDNAVSQKVAVRLLQQMGYRPDLAGNGNQALDHLDAQAFDLVLMDVLMPQMNGLETARHIRLRQAEAARHPTYAGPIAIVAMTACALPGDREKCLEAGMDDYLSKPIKREELQQVLTKWMAVSNNQ